MATYLNSWIIDISCSSLLSVFSFCGFIVVLVYIPIIYFLFCSRRALICSLVTLIYCFSVLVRYLRIISFSLFIPWWPRLLTWGGAWGGMVYWLFFCFSQFSFYFLLTPPSILGKALALGLDQALSSWSVSNVVLLFLLLGQACGTWSATWLLVRHSM
jgi:hypothetical protein